MANFDPNTHWRDSARIPKVVVLDFRLTLFYIILVIAPEGILLYAFFAVVIATIFFIIIENFNFTLAVSLRWLRSTFISGKYKKARPWWRVG